MGILNFAEIERPSKNKAKGIGSKDLDAFEKFAEEFFEKIIGGKILMRQRRGPDNSLDLKVEFDGKNHLVSCKHYAHSDTAINAYIESDMLLALTSNSCDKFIGFYSTGPTSSWITDLEGCKANDKVPFDYEIYKSSDIESKLLDSNNAKGWLLAARYFPKSYANLFQRFVIPIEHYRTSDVKETYKGVYKLDGPYGCHSASGNITKEEIAHRANDALTSALHKSFFLEALSDAINLFPRYFRYSQSTNQFELSLEDISPAWDQELSYDYPVDCNVPIIVASIWSFWDGAKAIERYIAFRVSTGEYIDTRKEKIMLPSILTIGRTAAMSNSELRNIFSRLIAFCPAGISAPHFKNAKSFESTIGHSIDWSFRESEGLEFLNSRLLGRT